MRSQLTRSHPDVKTTLDSTVVALPMERRRFCPTKSPSTRPTATATGLTTPATPMSNPTCRPAPPSPPSPTPEPRSCSRSSPSATSTSPTRKAPPRRSTTATKAAPWPTPRLFAHHALHHPRPRRGDPDHQRPAQKSPVRFRHLASATPANNTQHNELRWYLDVIDGKKITPSSGAHKGAKTIDYQKPYQAAGLDKSLPPGTRSSATTTSSGSAPP